MRYALAGLDRRLYRLSRGRVSVTGLPLFSWLLLTTTGRRSGQPRTTPLIYVRDGDRLVVTSENFGMAKRPAGWRLNLLANPDEEIVRYWPKLLDQWPALETYHRRSGVRYVFVLAPLAELSEPSGTRR